MFGLVDLLPSLSRKKKATHPTSKKPEKTASTKNTPPERPTAPKPSKNKEQAPEVITKPVTQQQPKRDSLEEKVTKQVDLTLPDDIERKYDSKTNRFYYLNHKDKTTSWSPPDGKIKQKPYNTGKTKNNVVSSSFLRFCLYCKYNFY
jgi:hypothetical protein